MKKLLFFFVLITILLSSCYTYEHAVWSISTWDNHTKRELISQWGAPNQVFTTDDGEILVYYGNSISHRKAWTWSVVESGTCKIQFFIDRSERIYTHSFENCGNKYIIEREYR
jgi:hypothetical protein